MAETLGILRDEVFKPSYFWFCGNHFCIDAIYRASASGLQKMSDQMMAWLSAYSEVLVISYGPADATIINLK